MKRLATIIFLICIATAAHNDCRAKKRHCRALCRETGGGRICRKECLNIFRQCTELNHHNETDNAGWGHNVSLSSNVALAGEKTPRATEEQGQPRKWHGFAVKNTGNVESGSAAKANTKHSAGDTEEDSIGKRLGFRLKERNLITVDGERVARASPKHYSTRNNFPQHFDDWKDKRDTEFKPSFNRLRTGRNAGNELEELHDKEVVLVQHAGTDEKADNYEANHSRIAVRDVAVNAISKVSRGEDHGASVASRSSISYTGGRSKRDVQGRGEIKIGRDAYLNKRIQKRQMVKEERKYAKVDTTRNQVPAQPVGNNMKRGTEKRDGVNPGLDSAKDESKELKYDGESHADVKKATRTLSRQSRVHVAADVHRNDKHSVSKLQRKFKNKGDKKKLMKRGTDDSEEPHDHHGEHHDHHGEQHDHHDEHHADESHTRHQTTNESKKADPAESPKHPQKHDEHHADESHTRHQTTNEESKKADPAESPKHPQKRDDHHDEHEHHDEHHDHHDEHHDHPPADISHTRHQTTNEENKKAEPAESPKHPQKRDENVHYIAGDAALAGTTDLEKKVVEINGNHLETLPKSSETKYVQNNDEDAFLKNFDVKIEALHKAASVKENEATNVKERVKADNIKKLETARQAKQTAGGKVLPGSHNRKATVYN